MWRELRHIFKDKSSIRAMNAFGAAARSAPDSLGELKAELVALNEAIAKLANRPIEPT